MSKVESLETGENFTVQRFNAFTIQQLHNSTLQRLHSSTIAQFNSSTLTQFNSYTIQRFNNSTLPQIHRLIIPFKPFTFPDNKSVNYTTFKENCVMHSSTNYVTFVMLNFLNSRLNINLLLFINKFTEK